MPTSDVPPPTTPSPEGWCVVSEEATTPFDALGVTVRARTITLADDRLRERVTEAAGAPAGDETTWRFFFASRLRVEPAVPPSRAVTRLVTRRANAGFADTLRERGFESVAAAESRRFAVRDAEADLTRYRARVVVGGVTVVAEGYVAVWPDDGGGFLVAGGAYPRDVESGPDAEALAALLDPDRFREALFEMVRATR